jgi:hypothetical protein
MHLFPTCVARPASAACVMMLFAGDPKVVNDGWGRPDFADDIAFVTRAVGGPSLSVSRPHGLT